MKISVESISKKFAQYPIFKNVTLQFESGQSYALLGANGSGKSTLLRIIAGMQSPSRGSISYSQDEHIIEPENIFKQISFCAPGIELVEEMTLVEFLNFHFKFKPMLQNLSIQKIIQLIGLEASQNKPLNDYSSGMKQRVKLAQAIFADTKVLLLDEPCTNLDLVGVEQYRNWIKQYVGNRLLIIASNEEREHDFCQHQIKMEDFK